jgi:hypothetical protein
VRRAQDGGENSVHFENGENAEKLSGKKSLDKV